MPVSGLAGLAYAWRYNQNGERTPILPKSDKETKKLGPKKG